MIRSSSNRRLSVQTKLNEKFTIFWFENYFPVQQRRPLSITDLEGVAVVAEDGRRSRRADQRRSVGTRIASADLVIGSRSGFRRIREHVSRHVVVHSFQLKKMGKFSARLEN